MPLTDLDFELPPALIAQHPAPERDASRLLQVRRRGAVVGHHLFAALPTLLDAGDLFVFNDTRVLPARLLGRRARTEGKWEGLYLKTTADGAWELLCQTRGRMIVGETILVDPAPPTAGEPLRLRLVGKSADGHWLAQPESNDADLLARFGQIPLPPYIRKGKAGPADRDRYQTVFAAEPGAVAAPTAGLHFTPRLFEALAARGVATAYVTLHVGLGTFQPVQAEDLAQHHVLPEWGRLPQATADALNACKAKSGRVVAVGTTSVRVLETAAAASDGPIAAWSGETALTIRPPHDFRAVDGLVTNFHLPRSSLLMLVDAFTGIESRRAAYDVAINDGYRFYSYGDAMVIL